MDSPDLKQVNARRETKRAALNKQLAGRRRNRADGDVHKVERRITPSRVQEAAASKEVDRGPVRRWQRASTLPGMPDLPDYSLKWVRLHGARHGDFANLVRSRQEGWEFARKSDFPDMFLPTHHFPEHGDCIGNDNTVLMKLHVELVAQRNAYYNDRRDVATKAVNRESGLQKAAHPAMPLVEDVMNATHDFHKLRQRRKARAQTDDQD